MQQKLCARYRMSVFLKAAVGISYYYKNVIIHVLMYESETCALINAAENLLARKEMRMLR